MTKLFRNLKLIFISVVLGITQGYCAVSPVNSNINFFGISADPMISAMGGNCTALDGSAAALLSNPAGIASLNQSKLSLSYTSWTDGAKYNFASYVLPAGHGNFACSLEYLGYGDSVGVNENLQGYSLSSSHEQALILSYAMNLEGKEPNDFTYGMIGANVKFVNRKLAYYTSEPIALDLGGICNLPFVDGLSSGLVYKNVGSTLPQSLILGLAYKPHDNKKISIAADGEMLSGSLPAYTLGLSVSPAYLMSLRCGWKQTNNPITSGVRLGFGLDVGSFVLNYALLPYDGVLSVHQIGIQIALGSIFNPQLESDYHLERHLKIAKKYFNAKEYIKARTELEQILSLYPDYVPALDYLNQTAAAVDHWNYRNEISDYLTKADNYLKENNILEAKKYYGTVLSIEPENLLAKAGMDRVNEIMQDMLVEKTQQNNSEMIVKLWETALYLYQRGEYIKAKEKFLELLAIAPRHKESLAYMADIDNQLAQISAGQINEMYTAGTELFKTGRFKEAMRYFEAVVIAAPHRLDADDFVNRCRDKIREEEERSKNERLAKEQDRMRGEVEASNAKALKYYEEGDYPNAIIWFDKTNAIAAQYEFKNYQDDSKKYKDIMESNLADKHFKMGFDFYQKNKFESAYSEYRKSLQYNPNNASAKTELDRLAKSLAQQYYERGMSYYTQGDMEKARDLFTKSLSYQPDKEEPRRALERMK